MFRYFGYLLIVLMALALGGVAALFVSRGLAGRLEEPDTLRLIACDSPAAPTVAGGQAFVRAYFENVDYGRPIGGARLVARFPDGWLDVLHTPATGIAYTRRGGLAIGRHEFTVTLPSTQPRLDVRASAHVWILPADTRAVWVDAAALVWGPAAVGGVNRQDAAREALAAIKVLAAGRQPVYLVAGKAPEYAAVRLLLESQGVPPGPVIWLTPGVEGQWLGLLKRTWPRIDAVLASTPAVREAFVKFGVPFRQVPRADGWRGEPVEAVRSWREVVEGLSSLQGGERGAGDVK